MELLFLVAGLVIGGVIGAIASVFIYRNNEKKLDPIADRVDEVYAKVEEVVKTVKKK